MLLFLLLQCLPLPRKLFVAPALAARIAEHVRMPPQHLVGNAPGHVGEIELALFLGDTGVEYDVEKQIAKLFLEVVDVVTLDRVDQLVGFVECVSGNRLAGLAYIPGTTGFGIA